MHVRCYPNTVAVSARNGHKHFLLFAPVHRGTYNAIHVITLLSGTLTLHVTHVENINVAVLCSGGLDSTACIAYYQSRGYVPAAVWVDYGHQARNAELQSVTAVASYYSVPLFTVRLEAPNWHGYSASDEITGRNALLAFAALSAFPGKHGLISMGIHAGTSYVDCTLEFQVQLGSLVRLISYGRLEMDFPFGSWSKAEIGLFCRQEEVPVHLTYSCLRGTVPSCGECTSCRDRILLFERLDWDK